MTRRLAFCDNRNTPKHPAGGDEFAAFAKKWVGLELQQIWYLYNAATIRETVRQKIALSRPYDHVAFFGHGFPNRLGVWAPTAYTQTNAQQLASLMQEIIVPGAPVSLFCCHTAENGTGSKGFAQHLSAALPGSPVFGQRGAGHTVKNPRDCLFLDGRLIYQYPTKLEDYKRWAKWEWDEKDGGQRGLALATVEGWKAAEVTLGLKLEVG